MRCLNAITAVAAGVILVGGSLLAVEQEAPPLPGKNIAERNIFGLKPPAPPVEPPPPPPPPTKVNLTGILTLMGSKRAVLVITEQGKQGQSKILKEGEREGDIEVLGIDEVNNIVKIKNRDVEKDLDFRNDGINPPTGPAPTFATNLHTAIAGLGGTGGKPMPIQPPPNMPAGTIWQPGGVVIAPGSRATNAPATYTPPTRIIRTP